MNAPYVDFLAIVIAALANIIIGFIWYARSMFGQFFERPRQNVSSFLWSCLMVGITATILEFFEVYLGVTTVSDGVFVGFLAWLGFVVTTQASALIWGKMSLKHFLIHVGGQFVSFLVMGGILAS